jgi:hypothetical protein
MGAAVVCDTLELWYQPFRNIPSHPIVCTHSSSVRRLATVIETHRKALLISATRANYYGSSVAHVAVLLVVVVLVESFFFFAANEIFGETLSDEFSA